MAEAGDIGFHDIAIRDGRGWFFNCYYSAIFSLDLDTLQLRLEQLLPDEYFGIYKFSNLAFYNDLLVIAPRTADKILIYDTEAHSIKTVQIKPDYIPDGAYMNLFYGLIIYGDAAYLFPGRYRTIVRLDMKTDEVTYITKWNQGLRNINPNSIVFQKVIQTGTDSCYLPCFQSNQIMKFCLSDSSYEYIDLDTDSENKGFVDIVKRDDERYFISLKNIYAILEWNDKTRECKKVFAVEKERENERIKNIICGHEYVYADVKNCSYMEQFRTDFVPSGEKIMYGTQWNKYEDVRFPSEGLMAYKWIGRDRVIFSVNHADGVAVLDCITGQITHRGVSITETDREQLNMYLRKNYFHGMHEESSYFNLKDFLTCMIADEALAEKNKA